MDGPISTSESAGSAQQAGFVPVRTLSVGPPERVPPVSEEGRSRSTGRDEVGVPGKARNASSGHNKAEQQVEEKTQGPAYIVEIGLPSADPSRPKRPDDLTDLLEAAKQRWAEVYEEVLEGSGVQPRAATRYQSLAMALSNPNQTRPIIDLFV
jgi:hypothetical protein